jgi:hypothetical protein
LLLYSSNLLLGFPTGRSFTTHSHVNLAPEVFYRLFRGLKKKLPHQLHTNKFWHHHHRAIRHELIKSNPGSKFFLSTNRSNEQGVLKEHLATLYYSYDACKRGFLEGCRPFICIDSCHIKTRYKGVLLTAVGIDANDCIFLIEMGVCEVECTSSWEWFLTTPA